MTRILWEYKLKHCFRKLFGNTYLNTDKSNEIAIPIVEKTKPNIHKYMYKQTCTKIVIPTLLIIV